MQPGKIQTHLQVVPPMPTAQWSGQYVVPVPTKEVVPTLLEVAPMTTMQVAPMAAEMSPSLTDAAAHPTPIASG